MMYSLTLTTKIDSKCHLQQRIKSLASLRSKPLFFAEKMPVMNGTPNRVIKAMSDVQSARKTLLRVNVISRTNFISAGYSLLELFLTLIMVLLMITLFKGVTSEVIIVFFVSLVYTYMYLLIKDIDDPFEYDQNGGVHGTEIPLFPLTEYLERAKERLESV